MSRAARQARLDQLELLPIRRMVRAGASLAVAGPLLGTQTYEDIPGNPSAWVALMKIAASANAFITGPPARSHNAVFKAMNAAGFADHRALRTITMGELHDIFTTLKPKIDEALR